MLGKFIGLMFSYLFSQNEVVKGYIFTVTLPKYKSKPDDIYFGTCVIDQKKVNFIGSY